MNKDTLLQSSGHFYLGILKYFVNLVIKFPYASQNQSSILIFPGGHVEASWQTVYGDSIKQTLGRVLCDTAAVVFSWPQKSTKLPGGHIHGT